MIAIRQEIELQDIENMTVKEINDQIKKLENQENYYYNEMEVIFNKTQPKATNVDKERVQGGTKRENRFLNYTIECEDEYYQKLKEKYFMTQDRKFNLIRYVEEELKRIGEYDPLMKKIVELRETSKLTWEQIGQATNYSERQCRRIYRKYKNKRDI